MSMCSCAFDGEPTIAYCEKGPYVARKARVCAFCHGRVVPGDLCVDGRWLGYDWGGGARAHEICFVLAAEWYRKRCGMDGPWWAWFDFDEASQHAVAHGDDPFWRSWLQLLEQAWTIQPEYTEEQRERKTEHRDCDF